MAKYAGSCQCGDIKFTIDADPYFAGHCHCRDCQRASGAGHVTSAGFPPEALKVSGATAKYESKSDGGLTVVREFCPRCGARLFSHAIGTGPYTMVALAALDEPNAITPGAHIFLKSRQPWDALDAALPVFEAMPPMPG